MKKQPKKLKLAKETIASLMTGQIEQVKGAWMASGFSCTSGNELWEAPCELCAYP